MTGELLSLYETLATSLKAAPSPFVDGKPVLVYGAGTVGKDVCRLLTHQGVLVLGLLDRAAEPGTTWAGLPIWTPDSEEVPEALRRSVRVVIGLFNQYVEMSDVEQNLEALGYRDVLGFLELHDCYPEELGDRFWLTKRSRYLGTETVNASVHRLWSDDLSRELHRSVLRARFTKRFDEFPKPEGELQYFCKSLPRWSEPLRIVDCGAFDGDTLRTLAQTDYQVAAIAAFEPDLANFSKLSQTANSTKSLEDREVVILPCGVGASTSQVRFSSGQGSGSSIASDGDVVIQCVAIDEALPHFRPSLIKMDIEGAELDALWGARRSILTHRPGLAICLYHRPEHLWQIPLLVHAWYGDGARYFLRSHWKNGFDLVMYVFPS